MAEHIRRSHERIKKKLNDQEVERQYADPVLYPTLGRVASFEKEQPIRRKKSSKKILKKK